MAEQEGYKNKAEAKFFGRLVVATQKHAVPADSRTSKVRKEQSLIALHQAAERALIAFLKEAGYRDVAEAYQLYSINDGFEKERYGLDG